MILRTTTFVLLAAIVLILGAAAARSRDASFQTSPGAKPTPCKTSDACLSETNHGTGAALEGVSLEPKRGSYGEAAILARGKGIGGIYSFSQLSYGGEFESNGTGYALIAAADNSTGTAFLAETTSSSVAPAILALAKGSQSGAGPAIEALGGGVTGLFEAAPNGTAVEGVTQNGIGGYFAAAGNTPALVAENDNIPGSVFEASSPYGTIENFDSQGNAFFDGVVAAAAFKTNLREGSTMRNAFGSESTRASLEDTGTAVLTAGKSIVRFDAAFAQAINANAGYQVFLTPGGETRGWLYVAQKFTGGFVVREALGGRSSVPFDYRVVAQPLGASGARLPAVHLPNPPPIAKPKHIPAP